MAMEHGKDENETPHIKVIKKPKRKTWFLHGDLVRILHVSRAQGIVILWSHSKSLQMTTTLVEFKKKRKKAFTIAETASLLNYHKKSIPRLVKAGMLPPAVGVLPEGKTAFHYLSYYSEDHIWEARNLMAQTHMGRARKDGRVTNNKTPTEQELKYAMGEGMIYYVKNDEGRFIPVFSETM
jgi:hypothetical protein